MSVILYIRYFVTTAVITVEPPVERFSRESEAFESSF